MENRRTADELIHDLAGRFRVLCLGGVAVISHGLDRNTHDADIWIDPGGSSESWARSLAPQLFTPFADRPVSIGSCEPVSPDALATVIDRDGVLRVVGLDRPLDIFRIPNELAAEDFDVVWERARSLDDGTRLPDVIDLLQTKQDTGRDKDRQDILFLEAKAEREVLSQLPWADEKEALFLLGRFLTPTVAEAALEHPAPGIRALGGQFLRELAGENNPFARDILARRTPLA